VTYAWQHAEEERHDRRDRRHGVSYRMVNMLRKYAYRDTGDRTTGALDVPLPSLASLTYLLQKYASAIARAWGRRRLLAQTNVTLASDISSLPRLPTAALRDHRATQNLSTCRARLAYGAAWRPRIILPPPTWRPFALFSRSTCHFCTARARYWQSRTHRVRLRGGYADSRPRKLHAYLELACRRNICSRATANSRVTAHSHARHIMEHVLRNSGVSSNIRRRIKPRGEHQNAIDCRNNARIIAGRVSARKGGRKSWYLRLLNAHRDGCGSRGKVSEVAIGRAYELGIAGKQRGGYIISRWLLARGSRHVWRQGRAGVCSGTQEAERA